MRYDADGTGRRAFGIDKDTNYWGDNEEVQKIDARVVAPGVLDLRITSAWKSDTTYVKTIEYTYCGRFGVTWE